MDLLDENKDIHILPRTDVIVHEETEKCVCGPVWDLENKKEFNSGLAVRKLCVHNRIVDSLQ